jgi:hypothetical protein
MIHSTQKNSRFLGYCIRLTYVFFVKSQTGGGPSTSWLGSCDAGSRFRTVGLREKHGFAIYETKTTSELHFKKHELNHILMENSGTPFL